ncbi:MAG: hypothetical protein Q9220_001164 [cf. Caloplaca sp. 1 TL-2023]
MASKHVTEEAATSVQETQFTGISDQPGSNLDDASAPRPDFPKTDPASPFHSLPDSVNIIHRHNAALDASANGNSAGNGIARKTLKHAASPRALAPDLLRGLLMVLQAIDHCSVSQGAWRHGMALEPEQDGTIVNEWNDPVPWTARMLTHLCAPGFMFLLGMGIVYFGNSRSKLGWSAWQMTKHFAIRAFVLAALNQLCITLPAGRGKIIITNFVLLALAINYLLAGLLWLAINASEQALSMLLEFLYAPSDNDYERPLLQGDTGPPTAKSVAAWAVSCSWHTHNGIFLAFTILSIAWNHWLSPHHGLCPPNTSPGYVGPTQPTGTGLGPWFDFWFLTFQSRRIISPFPPLAWLSPAVLGLLYGRVVISRKWKTYTINSSNAVFGVSLMLLFVLTRILQFGNLSEDCLRMPEQTAAVGRNQYLVSFRAFLYIIKYPPSFSYMAFTMSINFFLLALFGTLPEHIARRIPTLLTFGQSALFFYIIHLLLFFAMGMFVKTWFGHELNYTDPMTGKQAVGTEGQPAVMWGTFFIGLAILWPLCRWYGRFKSTKGSNSVWRFF